MQWDDSENAGFSSGAPWIMVNPNYKSINAKAELDDPDSVFHYYKKLIALRRNSPWSDLIVYGSYELLSPEDEAVYAYTREKDGQKLLIVCNLSPKTVLFHVPAEVSWQNSETVIATADGGLERNMELHPWQACVYALK